MPLVPSSPATPTRKEKGTQFPENAGSSWSRLWIAQHPPKASKAEVTVHPPSLVAAEEKYPPLSDLEHISPLQQILPLYSLPSIAELPKQEVHLKVEPEAAASPWLPTQESQEEKMSTIQVPRRTSEPGNSDSTNVSNGKIQEIEGISRMMSISPLSPIAEAAGVPLPSSPASEDFPDHLSSNDGQQSAQSQGSDLGAPTAKAVERAGRPSGGETDTWTSRLSSMLPDAIMDRPSRQSTGIANTRASRSSSIAPGAYPESDSTEESLKQNQNDQVEHTHPKTDQSRPNEKTVRSRKSVSIVLPGTSNEIRTGQEEQEDDMRSSEEHRDSVSQSRSRDEIDNVAKAEQDPKEDQDPKTPQEQAKADVSPKLLQTPTQQDASVKSRRSSIAASHNDTDRSDLSTLHERESLAPSDADNSSLMPLLSSSPGDARSSHFTESLDENHASPVTERPREEAEKSQKKAANPHLIVDDSSSLSSTDSPRSSKTEKPHTKRKLGSPFGPAENGEGPSNAVSSLPPPKIFIKAASSAEESSPNPSLVAPATTPEQDDPTLPRRQTTFIALGEQLNDERPIKLPMKGRKLYVRKIRYAILRQPILNAALGRQVGVQAKHALKKLANGELIVVEPPASL
ncbi:MAG: hypothetical protein L6R42_000940 [Xanthoria sp. 1 TBL-2021]|nr:MAG: hypothetical protein L6R42_000940 [Xanthoria sp. 1 TBL-2021]